jgi:ubiquinone/menaquinone biosynthesis C-methylase UbiE
MSAADVVWHDVECGGYDADVSLWIELAGNAPEGVLDVGAGTGRVALRLAQAGFDVTALDIEPELLAVLEQRAAKKGVRIATLTADASDFELPEPVGLIAVPMQTIQLLPERDGFFASARRALVPGGRVAIAIATELDPYDGAPPLPVPDFGESGGSTYISQPVAIRVYDDYVEIERIRQIVSATGERTSAGDLIRLSVVTPGELAEEAAVHGLEAEELLHIAETPEHVASQVVVFRG